MTMLQMLNDIFSATFVLFSLVFFCKSQLSLKLRVNDPPDWSIAGQQGVHFLDFFATNIKCSRKNKNTQKYMNDKPFDMISILNMIDDYQENQFRLQSKLVFYFNIDHLKTSLQILAFQERIKVYYSSQQFVVKLHIYSKETPQPKNNVFSSIAQITSSSPPPHPYWKNRIEKYFGKYSSIQSWE